MAKLPFDAQKIYHFLRDHPEWDVTYHELPRFLLVGYLPFVPSHWVTLRNHRREICVRISCDRLELTPRLSADAEFASKRTTH